MSGLLIIDGNSICHAAHHATKLTVGGMQTQAIFGTIKSIRVFAERNPGWSMLVLWDGKAQWRLDLFPEYKGNRKAKDEAQAADKEAYSAQSPYVRKALQLLGIRQMLSTSLEADDLAGVMVRRGRMRIKLISGDQDWLQLVNEGTTWFDPIRNQNVSPDSLFEFSGYYTPRAFLDGKALQGDSSDNIPGVGGIGKKGAPEFMAQFKSVAEFFAQVDSGFFVPKKKAHQNLASVEGRAAYQRNLRLMNLLEAPDPVKEDLQVIAPTYNEDGFRILAESLAFMSILRDFDNFMAAFRDMQPLAKAA